MSFISVVRIETSRHVQVRFNPFNKSQNSLYGFAQKETRPLCLINSYTEIDPKGAKVPSKDRSTIQRWNIKIEKNNNY